MLWRAGLAAGLRAAGPKADFAMVVAEGGAVAAGVFTTNVMCAAPVTFCRQVLEKSETARAVGSARYLPLFEEDLCSILQVSGLQ